LLDVMMPRPDGYEVCSHMKNDPKLRHSQIIMVSAKTDIDDRLRGYKAGADDYVTRPFESEELLAKVNASFRKKTMFDGVRTQMNDLCGATGEALELVTHLRDKETGEHLDRLRIYSHLLANELRRYSPKYKIDESFLYNLDRASPLHDIGKVAIPDAILNKPGPLTPEEREQMQQHTLVGEHILKCLAEKSPDAQFFPMAAEIARWHHESFDGSGYPDGLRGKDIPLAARIVKVADVFDALTSTRVYKSASDPYEACEYLTCTDANKFDPDVLDAMLRAFDQFTAVCRCPNSVELSLLVSMSTFAD